MISSDTHENEDKQL